MCKVRVIAKLIKRGEMDGVCGTYEGEERCRQGLVGRTEGERDLFEDLGVDGRIKHYNWLYINYQLDALIIIYS